MATRRIIHCLRAPVGGLFRHVRDLATEQSARGHDVAVLCDDLATDSLTEERLRKLDEKISLGVHRTSMSRGLGFSDVAAFRRTRDLIHALQIDVAHGHGAKGGAHARLAARALSGRGLRVQTYYTPHGGSLNYQPGTLAGRFFMTLERQLIPATDGLVFESAYAQRQYLEHVGGRDTRRRVIFNGLQRQEFFDPEIEADATDLVFIGELRAAKGIDVLINALGEVRKTHSATLTVVGEGRLRAGLEQQTKDLGLQTAVRFLGAMPARQAFTKGRVMVVPSRAESLPYVVLEAAAAALPLIATDVGGISEIVEGSDTRLIASDDVSGLAAAIREQLDNPERARELAAHLRDLVAKRFSVTTMTDAILDFYDEADQLALAA